MTRRHWLLIALAIFLALAVLGLRVEREAGRAHGGRAIRRRCTDHGTGKGRARRHHGSRCRAPDRDQSRRRPGQADQLPPHLARRVDIDRPGQDRERRLGLGAKSTRPILRPSTSARGRPTRTTRRRSICSRSGRSATSPT